MMRCIAHLECLAPRPSSARAWLGAVLCLILASAWAQPRLNIEITGGTEVAQPIAIVPFGAPEAQSPPLDLAAIISDDLARTGRFRPMAARDMLDRPTRREEIDFRDWSLLGMHNLVIGRIEPAAGGYQVSFALFDVFRATELANGSLTVPASGLRQAAHRIADEIYERLTGQPGVAATRIAYVSTSGSGDSLQVSLRVADADGYNPQTIVSSGEPILSPAWSPDGRRLAYVSFENKRPAIYIQELATGRRELVASYPGINGSPAFSPDGGRLAMTLSKDGNPEIYVLDLASRALKRLTDHFAIDTEPAWSPDGQWIVFTSDRAGSPQIYRMPASGGPAERLSREGDYNARASYAPDGRSLVMVSRLSGAFRIALLDLESGTTRLLSRGELDESPSFAPNGAMVIYATIHQGRGVLATAAVAGGVSQRFSQDSGEIRDPAWSPLGFRGRLGRP